MTNKPLTIRDVQRSDAAQILDIYGPMVIESAVSFELQTPSIAELRERIDLTDKRWPWIVLESPDQLLGYAYARPFRAREAYQQTAETTVYVHPQHQGMGVGRQLMEYLLTRLRAVDHHTAVAGIALPNPASVGLHERLGFKRIGVFPEVGRKFDQWHDVGFWSLHL